MIEFSQGGQHDPVHLSVELPQPIEGRLVAIAQDAIGVFEDDIFGLQEGHGIARHPRPEVGKGRAVWRGTKTIPQDHAADLAAPRGKQGCGRVIENNQVRVDPIDQVPPGIDHRGEFGGIAKTDVE